MHVDWDKQVDAFLDKCTKLKMSGFMLAMFTIKRCMKQPRSRKLCVQVNVISTLQVRVNMYNVLSKDVAICSNNFCK